MSYLQSELRTDSFKEINNGQAYGFYLGVVRHSASRK